MADEVAQQMVDDAVPHLHHSCASLAETAGDDQDMVLEIVTKMVIVSFYNRGLGADFAGSEEDKGAMREVFLQEVSDACAEDPDALLAGLVDSAVKSALGL